MVRGVVSVLTPFVKFGCVSIHEHVALYVLLQNAVKKSSPPTKIYFVYYTIKSEHRIDVIEITCI